MRAEINNLGEPKIMGWIQQGPFELIKTRIMERCNFLQENTTFQSHEIVSLVFTIVFKLLLFLLGVAQEIIFFLLVQLYCYLYRDPPFVFTV